MESEGGRRRGEERGLTAEWNGLQVAIGERSSVPRPEPRKLGYQGTKLFEVGAWLASQAETERSLSWGAQRN